MLLKATYTKKGDGRIRAQVWVKDKGDYTGDYLFDNYQFPYDSYVTVTATGVFSKTLSDAEEARIWVAYVVDEHLKALTEWRSAQCPEPEEFEI